MFALGGVGITLFLGGWSAPVSFLSSIPAYVWFFAKLFALIAMFIWVRSTLPRLRMAQLMNFAWKFMLPMGLLNLVNAAVWRFLPSGLSRWLVCAVLVIVLYILLGRGLVRSKKLEQRVYRVAD